MSVKIARTHTHRSNRVKPFERKIAFKSVLDNPYRISWPSVPLNLQNAILARLISALEGVSEYTSARDRAHKYEKRKCRESSTLQRPEKKRKSDDGTSIHESNQISDMVVNTSPVAIPDEPPILGHLTVGINEVTRKLESQLKAVRLSAKVTPSDVISLSNARPVIKSVFVCRDDVDPPFLISHIPHLIAAYNSACASAPIKTIPLPKNSESTLAAAVGLRRAAILALDAEATNDLHAILDTIPPLIAPWLTMGDKELIPTHVKQVRTTAPTDMKASKAMRVSGRKAAKEHKKPKT